MSDQLTDAELIEAVAIEVMGWQPGISSDIFCGWITPAVKVDGNPGIFIGFNPLEDANHWMMVCTKMRELGFDILIYDNYMAGGQKKWVARFDKLGISGASGGQDGIGIAVCLASLNAIRSMKT